MSRSPTSHRPQLALALTVVMMLTIAVNGPHAGAVPASSPITIEGGGWGHGIGMPQYGARGMAEEGFTFGEILGYFYTGTGLAHIADTSGSSLPGTIRVGTHLVAGTQVRPFLWLDFSAVNGPVGLCLPGEDAESCSFALVAGETWRVAWNEASEQCTVARSGSIVHTSDDCGFRLEWGDQPNTRVSIPELDRVFPRGALEFVGPVVFNQRGFHLVAELTMQEYLYGIAEVPVSWHREALRAQVVAARTYAAEMTRSRIAANAATGGLRPDCSCHIRWTTNDQVYRGWHTLTEGNATHGADWRAAVDDTAGLVVTRAPGAMAETFYFSSSGGATENVWDMWGSNPVTYPYLASVPDPWSERYTSEAPWIRWARTLTAGALASALGFDAVVTMEVTARYGSGSPRVIEVRGTQGGQPTTATYTGRQLQTALGLRSHFIYSISGFAVPERVAGSDRYATAIAASQRVYPDGAGTVYVAVGTNYPDAIAAGPAAAAEDAPILLVQSGLMPSITRTELQRLNPDRVVVLGGPIAISDSVVSAIASAVPEATVQRRSGSDRYATAVEISRAVFAPGVDTVFVATGESFPDALLAAPAGVGVASPLLLVRPGQVPPPVRDEIVRLAPSRIVIIGGTSAVSTPVADDLAAIAPVQRISANDRYGVSAAVSAATYPGGSDVVYIAVGDAFPDALAAGPLTGSDPGPLLLVRTHSLPPVVAAELGRLSPSRIVILGGPAAVSEDVALLIASYQS